MATVNSAASEAIENLATGKVLWIHRQRAPFWSAPYWRLRETWSSLEPWTASSSAYHAGTGKLLWQTQLNAAPNSSPVTYSVQGSNTSRW